MDAVPEAPDESSGNSTLVKSEDGSPQQEGGRSSPPPNCAICLGRCKNKSFTDSCLHQFCFKCLLTWSRVKTECPLCKQNFKSIIHNVKSNHQYEEYPVEQTQGEERGQSIDISEIVNAARRFRYRTTLTLPRRESLAIQQFLMHYPLAALVDMPRPAGERHTGDRHTGERHAGERHAGERHTGVLARERSRRATPIEFRRTVYRHNLWARPLPDFTGRFRDCTPTFFRYNDSQIHRLMPWLNRELQYLLNENAGHITYVMARILELLPEHPIVSPEFHGAVQCYFGERTEHFLHEFHCFASTPYDITGYDRHVQYQTDARVSGIVSEVLSSCDSDSRDSDIVMVSSSHASPGPSRPPSGSSRPPPGSSRPPSGSSRPPSGTSRPPSGSGRHAPGSSRSQSGSSRSTPGYGRPPAGSSRQPAPAAPPPPPAYPRGYIAPEPAVIPIETISHSDSDSGSSEVMVVGYIKPPHQRTPELVDLLASDSDVVVQEDSPPPSPSLRRLSPSPMGVPPSPAALSPLPPSPMSLSALPPSPRALPPLPPSPSPPPSARPANRRGGPLVRIKLSVPLSQSATESEAEPDESYTPPRRKRARRPVSSSESGGFRESRSSSSSSSSSSAYSSYSGRRGAAARRRPPRRSARAARGAVRNAKRSPRPRKGRKTSEENYGSRKGKSSDGRDVKKTCRSSPPPSGAEGESRARAAGASAARKRSAETSPRRRNRDGKKLKSVVKVMKRVSDSGSIAGTSKTEDAESGTFGAGAAAGSNDSSAGDTSARSPGARPRRRRGSGSGRSRASRAPAASSTQARADAATNGATNLPKFKPLAVGSRDVPLSYYINKDFMDDCDSSSSDDNIPLSRSLRCANSTD